MKLFFDRSYDYGCVAVWVGKCKSRELLVDYAFSKYEGEDFTTCEFQKQFQRIFLPENNNRDVEEELKEHFSAGMKSVFV